MEKDEQETFQVKDRRRFVADESGAVQSNGKPSEEEKKTASEEPKQDAREKAKEKACREELRQLPAIDFPTFVLSLSSSALLHLGLAQNPMTGKTERNLPLAKQTIDILGMLREKTKGNLSSEESDLLENLVADLRIKYVNECKR